MVCLVCAFACHYTGIHQFKLTIAKAVGNKLVRQDPIPPVASSIASEAHLLCFDEFQVAIVHNCHMND